MAQVYTPPHLAVFAQSVVNNGPQRVLPLRPFPTGDLDTAIWPFFYHYKFSTNASYLAGSPSDFDNMPLELIQEVVQLVAARSQHELQATCEDRFLQATSVDVQWVLKVDTTDSGLIVEYSAWLHSSSSLQHSLAKSLLSCGARWVEHDLNLCGWVVANSYSTEFEGMVSDLGISYASSHIALAWQRRWIYSIKISLCIITRGKSGHIWRETDNMAYASQAIKQVTSYL